MTRALIFDKWSKQFDKELRDKFKEVRSTKKKQGVADGAGVSTRSSDRDDLLVDNEAVALKTTNAKRLTKLTFESIVTKLPDSKVILYIRKDTSITDDLLNGVPTHVRGVQQEKNIAGDIVKVGSKQYIVLKATIVQANAHIDINAGGVSLKRLQTIYKQKEGFVVQFDGTDKKLTFSWTNSAVCFSTNLCLWSDVREYFFSRAVRF